MATKTLKELRARARTRRIKGFSKMSRQELLKRLAGKRKVKSTMKETPHAPRKNKSAAKKITAAQSPTKPARRSGKKSLRLAARRKSPGLVIPPGQQRPGISSEFATEEERVEDAKYVSVLPGAYTPAVESKDLGEDIENLPPIVQPMLCLLPQRPGILHGYWVIPPDAVANMQSLKLRLGQLNGELFDIFHEIAVPQPYGHWYFQLEESANVGAMYLQLGYYGNNGHFIIATRRGIARIPSLYASDRTDRLWWVSEERFRGMYLRAGGFLRGPRLGWNASIGSSSGMSSELLARQGKFGDRQK